MIDLALQLPDAFNASGRTGFDASGASTAGQELATRIGASEWLGPMAPIALSPFFGIALLSGVATYGPKSLTQHNGLIHDNSPLNSPLLFWVMVALAVITSLPRFSKVSKPVALAAEKVEAYSAVIILFIVKLLGSQMTGSDFGHQTLAGEGVVTAGFMTLSIELLMSVAAALNVIVINAVKLFFEFLVWLIPIPLVDAALETGQKTLCLAMMSLYCYSPVLATILNLMLLAACGIVFSWVYRKTKYYRHMIAGPVLAWIAPTWFAQKGPKFTAYCTHAAANMPPNTQYQIHRISDDEYEATGRWLWRTSVIHFRKAIAKHEPGVLAQTLQLRDADHEMTFAYRQWVSTDAYP